MAAIRMARDTRNSLPGGLSDTALFPRRKRDSVPHGTLINLYLVN